MPTYDYRCEKCGNEFEEFLLIAKRAEPTESPCEKELMLRNLDGGVDEQTVCGGKISQVIGSTPPAFKQLATLSSVLASKGIKNLPAGLKDKKVIQQV